MWNRKNLKENAKAAFKRNYWKCVLVAIILGIVSSSGSINVSTNSGSSISSSVGTITDEQYYEDDEYYEDHHDFEDIVESVFPSAISGIIVTLGIALILVLVLVGIVISIFIFGPLKVGCANFFKHNAYEKAELNRLTLPFKKSCYWNSVKTMFLKDLFITLWTFLLIVPGIIKSYEYRLIPYILSDSPGISRKDAFAFSREMMRGHKWDAFILDLSFIGWNLLAVITCGLAGIFYVSPYVAATDAELFIAIREEYFKDQRG